MDVRCSRLVAGIAVVLSAVAGLGVQLAGPAHAAASVEVVKSPNCGTLDSTMTLRYITDASTGAAFRPSVDGQRQVYADATLPPASSVTTILLIIDVEIGAEAVVTVEITPSDTGSPSVLTVGTFTRPDCRDRPPTATATASAPSTDGPTRTPTPRATIDPNVGGTVAEGDANPELAATGTTARGTATAGLLLLLVGIGLVLLDRVVSGGARSRT